MRTDYFIKRYFIYGLIGWNIEVIWTGLSSLISGDMRLSSFTSLWMFFIYGLAVFLEPLHDIMKSWNMLFRGILWVVIIWGIEYATGLVLRVFVGSEPWLYTGPFAVDGLVRLDYGAAWFVAGLVFEKIHTKLDYYEIGVENNNSKNKSLKKNKSHV